MKLTKKPLVLYIISLLSGIWIVHHWDQRGTLNFCAGLSLFVFIDWVLNNWILNLLIIEYSKVYPRKKMWNKMITCNTNTPWKNFFPYCYRCPEWRFSNKGTPNSQYPLFLPSLSLFSFLTTEWWSSQWDRNIWLFIE